jgi:SOS-response transcriptional repressor LexA
VLDYISSFIGAKGYAPSIIEIAEHLDVNSTFGVRKHIHVLLEKGVLKRGGPGLSRSLTIADSKPTNADLLDSLWDAWEILRECKALEDGRCIESHTAEYDRMRNVIKSASGYDPVLFDRKGARV